MSMNKAVNLLDTQREPTDAQLRSLMRSVANGVKERKVAADQALRVTLASQIQAARALSLGQAA
jgi:hypothetical protein